MSQIIAETGIPSGYLHQLVYSDREKPLRFLEITSPGPRFYVTRPASYRPQVAVDILCTSLLVFTLESSGLKDVKGQEQAKPIKPRNHSVWGVVIQARLQKKKLCGHIPVMQMGLLKIPNQTPETCRSTNSIKASKRLVYNGARLVTRFSDDLYQYRCVYQCNQSTTTTVANMA